MNIQVKTKFQVQKEARKEEKKFPALEQVYCHRPEHSTSQLMQAEFQVSIPSDRIGILGSLHDLEHETEVTACDSRCWPDCKPLI